MESLLTFAIVGLPVLWLIYESYKYVKRGTPDNVQPKWARDKAEIRQGPLFGEEAAGYVENKMKRFQNTP